MADTCPSCSAANTLSHALSQQLCSKCGYISQDVDLYEPNSRFGSQVGSTSQLPSHLHTGPVSREQSRKLESYRRKPEVVARIKLALQRLERPNLFEQVDFLFDHARSESWRRSDEATTSLDLPGYGSKRRPVQWGEPSFSLAAACCFAVLRREGHLVDVAVVAHAADLPVLRVRDAVRRLRRLVPLQPSDVQLSSPDAYIQRFCRYFIELANAKDSVHPTVRKFLQPLVSKRRASIDIERTALDLCSFWWPRRPVSACDPILAAFVIVVITLEAHVKAAAPRHHIFLLFPQAVCAEVNARASSVNARSQHALWERHREVLSALDHAAQQFPWLMSRSRIVERMRNRDLRFFQLELLANLTDILQICKTHTPEKSAQQDVQLDSPLPRLDQALQVLEKPQHGHQQAAMGSPHTEPQSEQDGLDSLSDDELDALLFTADELQSMFRTSQSERDALLEAKVAAGIWDRKASDGGSIPAKQLVSAPSDRSRPAISEQRQPKRNKLCNGPQADPLPSVLLDEQQAESDWSDNDR